jgi:hypothetical protein
MVVLEMQLEIGEICSQMDNRTHSSILLILSKICLSQHVAARAVSLSRVAIVAARGTEEV